MAQFHLITGFLGSGKTTFLSNILKELAPLYKVAVIQNEFAPSGVDGKELQRQTHGFKLVEINNGSVFCVCQLSNFKQTLLKLITDYAPEQIFLEASGLADPISVVELLQVDGLKELVSLGQIISLVDAANFFKGLNGLVRFKHQVMVADKVILNKTDLADEATLSAIKKEVKQLNPFAEIIPAVFARIPWEQCLAIDTSVGQAALQYLGKSSEGRPDMRCCVLRTHDQLDEAKVRPFIEALQASCPRIKGFLNLSGGKVVSVHSVYDYLALKILDNYQGPTELIAFGESVSISNLRKRLKEYCNN
ncbi:MAG: GTP-binding protein [Marinilabiliaceae bacterium]|nr:GTP-binding protein [Marinilabiliaceae bacterium]